MNTKKYHLDNYRKFLLNRVTASSHIVDYIENCVVSEDEAAPHSFHKVMVHNWSGNDVGLFETLSEYFSCSFVPVNCTSQGDITTFYTSSLNLILKMAKLDFMFPHQRNMFNVDILFNDKTSADCFDNRITIEDIVTGVLSSRLNDKCELDLSNFCKDQEFVLKKINFYKIALLSHFKILMIRIAKDTKMLNLSNNKLSQVPIELLNFFIKGNLTSINLSNNNIPSLSELHRVSSKIEKLWVEGNPLCEGVDPVNYVKQISMKFPRLTELDGIKLNEHGIVLPFFKNYLDTPDKKTQMLIEKFLSLYFAHYDSTERRNISMFYDANATLSISANLKGDPLTDHYTKFSRNISSLNNKNLITKQYSGRDIIIGVLLQFPQSNHDPTSFTVDVIKHDKKSLILIIDGVYKEKSIDLQAPDRIYQFRRTFVFHTTIENSLIKYSITNDMFSVSLASKERTEYYLKNPSRSSAPLALRNPDKDEADTISNVFSHLTQLKKAQAEQCLKNSGWDMVKALNEFIKDVKLNKEVPFKCTDNDVDDFSDTSSLLSMEDEI